MTEKRISRRDFLKVSGATIAAGFLAACGVKDTELSDLSEQEIKELMSGANDSKGREKLKEAVAAVAEKQENIEPLPVLGNGCFLHTTSTSGRERRASGLVMGEFWSDLFSKPVSLVLTGTNAFHGEGFEAMEISAGRLQADKNYPQGTIRKYDMNSFFSFMLQSPGSNGLGLLGLLGELPPGNLEKVRIAEGPFPGEVIARTYPDGAPSFLKKERFEIDPKSPSSLISVAKVGPGTKKVDGSLLYPLPGGLFGPGSEGGAIVNKEGRLCGVVDLLTPVDRVTSVLNSLPPNLEGVALARPVTYTDLSTLLKGGDGRGAIEFFGLRESQDAPP